MSKEPQYVVEVIDRKTNKVVETMGPCDYRRAEKIQRGVEINFNHNDYRTAICPAKEGT